LNVSRNLAAVDAIARIAKRDGYTPSQLALAWLLSRPHEVIPIPSTRSIEHFEENLEALQIQLTAPQVRELESAVKAGTIHGERHPADHMKTVNL
jgi:aryl-alcohol dehydrogenase-like predicted oxidoreductase